MTIDFIPIKLYSPLYFHLLLLFVISAFIHTHITKLGSASNIAYFRVTGTALFLFVLLYMGLRPISGVFVDMTTYYGMFRRYVWGAPVNTEKDALFQWFMYLSAKIMKASTFFFTCAAIYTIPAYIACKKWFNIHWYYPFLAIVCSLSFWAYGTNGIRNGMATSLFLLAVSRERLIWQCAWLVLAVGIHKSLAIPTMGYILTFFNNRSRWYLGFWLLCLPLALALPTFWQGLFASMIESSDDRAQYLTGRVNAGTFSRTGFRWDFLLYSSVGVFAGWYYIFRKKFNNLVYARLFNTYLFANGFWILVIRANFSNRFAYLSWFLLAVIIFFPLVKQIIVRDQHQRIGLILLGYFGFTYLMNVLM